MISLDRLDSKELTALRFDDPDSFTKAAEILVRNNVQLEPIGNQTLIIHSIDIEWLENKEIAFTRLPALDASRNGNGRPH